MNFQPGNKSSELCNSTSLSLRRRYLQIPFAQLNVQLHSAGTASKLTELFGAGVKGESQLRAFYEYGLHRTITQHGQDTDSQDPVAVSDSKMMLAENLLLQDQRSAVAC